MEAAEAKIQRVLEGSKQFLVPHFQRPYSWREEQWKMLWSDLTDLIEDAELKPHFLGPIVSAPARSVPEGVEKRLLIDGQQRLTTLLVLLILIRDRARELGNTKLAERIQDLVTNRHEDGNDHYKLLPTQGEDAADSDRDTFMRLVEATERRPTRSGIGAAYDFFARMLRRKDAPDIEVLQRSITTRLTLVSIILDEKDNPHRIFESLNGKGRPLSQADLIRNYFFMRLDEREHERVYRDLWSPMQQRLGEDALTDFVRHYLTRRGTIVRETDVYSALKTTIDEDKTWSPLDHLRQLSSYSEYYDVLLHPEKALSVSLRERLLRLNRLEVTVAYPFLLAVYADFSAGRCTEASLCSILDVIENFVIRRFVAAVPTHGLNKIFPPLYEQAGASADFVDGVKRVLAAKNCPRDEVFRESLVATRLYGGGERREKTKLILERLEAALGHKERAATSNMSIEHVMPQSLTDYWKADLGENWEEDHDELLHTLGNLTLTSYNPELSNSSFQEKKARFADSHVELNRYFGSVEGWTAKEIERRSEALAELALSVWPYFGPQQDATEHQDNDGTSVKGTVPSLVKVRDRTVVVQSWAEVAVAVMDAIAVIGDGEFNRITTELPRLVNPDPANFRRSGRPRRLSNDAYVETNLSASAIHRLCVQAFHLAGLGPDEWQILFDKVGGGVEDDESGSTDAPTAVKQLQLDFWTQVKPALEATGKFSSLRAPRPQYWYDISLGRTNFHLTLTANVAENRVGANIALEGDVAGRALSMLAKDRDSIEAVIGEKLSWNPYPDKKVKTIKLTQPMRLVDRSTWPVATTWLTQTAVKFREAFAQRILDLDIKSLRLPPGHEEGQ